MRNPKPKVQVTNQTQNPNDKTYDLEDRTANFGEDVIEFLKRLKKNEITRPLIGQVVRSATSIGANYTDILFYPAVTKERALTLEV